MLGTVNIKVRPLRMAMLVDPNSALQVREAIRLASSLWGGTYFPIIPVHKRMPNSWRNGPLKAPLAKEVVLGLIDAFDPDMLVQFAASLPDYIADTRLKVVKPEELWGEADDESADPTTGIGAMDVLVDLYCECFKYQARRPYKALIPVLPKQHTLFWASVFGEYPAHVDKAINRDFSEPLAIERPELTPDNCWQLLDADHFFPRRITAWALMPGQGLPFGNHACVFFMDASRVEDITDYWNLRASGRSVLPLPKQFLKLPSFADAVRQFLIDERRPMRGEPKIVDAARFVRSRNMTMEDMQSYAAGLGLKARPEDGPHNPYFVLQHWYPRLWNEWARGKDGGVVDVYAEDEESMQIESASELTIRLKPLIPKLAKDRWIRCEGVCVNEFDLRMFGADDHLAEVYPRGQGEKLSRAISGWGGHRDGWRIGRHGLVKVITSPMPESRTALASEDVFFAWLADRGWMAELSPPGILAKKIFKRLSGTPLLLANRSILGLIEHMNGGPIDKSGMPQARGRRADERDISVGELKSRLGGPDSFRYDDFIQRGIFTLGLRTKCPICQRTTWFPVAALRESLECPKCLGIFSSAGNIEKTGNSTWSYRTAGPFSVSNFADGAFAVLLTLDLLGDRMFTSMRTTSVPSFEAKNQNGKKLEADFGMFWRSQTYGETQDGILFGECKTYGKFENKDIRRMRDLAAFFPGAVLVFSTLRDELTKKEILGLARLAKAGRKHWKDDRPINPVLILTGNELLTAKRAPYCWDEALQRKFPRIIDLYSFSDASQQIYLKLPPLAEEWQKRFEQRQARSKVRMDAPPSTQCL